MESIIFIGLQASGKSSFYFEQFCDTHIRINLDMLKTRHREKILYQACLEAKQPVVIDNTNPTIESRKSYISLAKEHRFSIIGYYFLPDLEKSLQRNQTRTRVVPDIGIFATYKNLQEPTYIEGFDQLFNVSLEEGLFIIKERDAI